ncbi:MAG: ferredoxin family protein [Syntrophomonadaceae bacterium]|nr:ferredoxin family protein [Syntrophomonadaceae bacterium]MDD3890446.1 ferredoxin family protein [Syntrophomonadaceae bacterium]MDD4548414.1 ferredoxin family protein [Syntrophomonadaceae bacterium]
MEVVFNEKRCKGCGLCIEFCPRKIIALGTKMNDAGYHYPFIKQKEKCNGCAICAMMCPDVIIEVKGA